MATSQNRQVVIGAYREVLRAINFAFKEDRATILNARRVASEQFHSPPSNGSKPPRNPLRKPAQPVTIEEGVQHALSVAQILRENVVQGRAVEDEPTRFKLDIHEGIERGDNESIKMKTPLKGTEKSIRCCSS